jgi:23S rRNA pseudouridine2605 synthase
MKERLQKIIAGAGIASRRAAEEMIVRGEVTVNGERVTELGTKADAERDHIKVRGKLISPLQQRPKKYYLVNKLKGYVSSAADPQGRPLVAHLLPPSARRGLHPVGRLDFNTEGLIILTNDGDLTKLVTQGGRVAKVYHVKVKGSPDASQIERLRRGIKLGESTTSPAEIALLEKTSEGGNCWFEVTLREGKNQQIRRMFDSIGHSVSKLKRIRIGHLSAEALAPGGYRELTLAEVKRFYAPPVAPRSRKNRVNRKKHRPNKIKS